MPNITPDQITAAVQSGAISQDTGNQMLANLQANDPSAAMVNPPAPVATPQPSPQTISPNARTMAANGQMPAQPLYAANLQVNPQNNPPPPTPDEQKIIDATQYVKDQRAKETAAGTPTQVATATPAQPSTSTSTNQPQLVAIPGHTNPDVADTLRTTADVLEQNKNSLDTAVAATKQIGTDLNDNTKILAAQSDAAVAAEKETNQQYVEDYKQVHQESINRYNESKQGIAALRAQNIDPNHYWNNLDTGQQIGAALSIVLGGSTQRMNGGVNVGLQQINGAIKNDIDAQTKNLAKNIKLMEDNAALNQSQDTKDLAYITAKRDATIASYTVALDQIKQKGSMFTTNAIQQTALQTLLQKTEEEGLKTTQALNERILQLKTAQRATAAGSIGVQVQTADGKTLTLPLSVAKSLGIPISQGEQLDLMKKKVDIQKTVAETNKTQGEASALTGTTNGTGITPKSTEWDITRSFQGTNGFADKQQADLSNAQFRDALVAKKLLSTRSDKIPDAIESLMVKTGDSQETINTKIKNRRTLLGGSSATAGPAGGTEE